MIRVLGIFALALVAPGGVALGVDALGADPRDPVLAPAPSRSRVAFDTDAEGYTLTRYEVAATWRTAPDVTVDYEIIPRDRREATVLRMGRSCGECWTTRR